MSATYWPIVPAPGDCEDGEFGRMNGRGNRSTRRKPALTPLCPPQIPLDQTWDWTWAAAVESQRLTASAVVWPLKLYNATWSTVISLLSFKLSLGCYILFFLLLTLLVILSEPANFLYISFSFNFNIKLKINFCLNISVCSLEFLDVALICFVGYWISGWKSYFLKNLCGDISLAG
jgi:hypothetical protein